MASKLVDKFPILNNSAILLLTRLYDCKNKLEKGLFSDPQVQRAATAMARSFPNKLPPTDKSNEILVNKKQEIISELQSTYDLFVDLLEFHDITLQVLNEANQFVTFQLRGNQFLTENFLDLVVKFAQIHVFISTINERKNAIVLFLRAAEFENSEQIKPLNYVCEYDSPFRKLSTDFKPLTKLAQILNDILTTFMKQHNIAEMRKDGVLNLTIKPELMMKPIFFHFIFDLTLCGKIPNWVVWIYIFLPDELASRDALSLLRLALAYAFAIPINRDEFINLHPEYENLFASYKSSNSALNLKKEKKMINEQLVAAVGGAGSKMHFDRRTYVRQELANLYQFVQEFPALLGPKLQMILSGLALAKEELLWYFRHKKSQVPRNVSRSFKEADFRDEYLAQLIYLVDVFPTLIKKNRPIISRYYVEYLHGADLNNLRELIQSLQQKNLSSNLLQSLEAFARQLSSINTNSDCRVFRIEWYKLQAQMWSSGIPMQDETIDELMTRMNLIVKHTEYIDSLDDLLFEYAGLHELLYFKNIFIEEFNKCIDGAYPKQRYIMTFVKVLNQFKNAANDINLQERDSISIFILETSQTFITKISLKVVQLIKEITKSFTILENQFNLSNILYKFSNYKPDRPQQPPEPGSESEPSKRNQLEGLRNSERLLQIFLTAFRDETEGIIIGDNLLSPLVYLRESIADYFKEFIAKTIYLPNDKSDQFNLQRPSFIRNAFNVAIYVLTNIENFVSINISDLIRQILLGQSYHRILERALEYIHTPTEVNGAIKEVQWENDSLIRLVVSWYTEIILSSRINTITSSNTTVAGAVYCPTRKLFLESTASGLIKVEDYTNLNELIALFEIIGSYGYKLIEREILRFVQRQTTLIRDFIIQNKQPLTEFATNFKKDGIVVEIIKKLKDFDLVINRFIAIGNALNLRKLMREALKIHLDNKCTFIPKIIGIAFNQYPKNLFLVANYLPIDLLAADCGLDLHYADQPLKSVLSHISTSRESDLWNLLPFVWTLGLFSKSGSEAVFKSLLEAHLNNFHSSVTAIVQLIICLKVTAHTEESSEREIAFLIETLLNLSASQILKLLKQSKDSSNKTKIASLVILLEKIVIEAEDFVSREVLENIFPHAIVRGMYNTLNRPIRGAKEAEDA
eukprot:TRINITY_DN437_c2_g1_i1.p1 TRINITY_DN437_c2_g1~~TRINITY_DN437_c2_g1_i1.p1  ORF type:complete len:1146 (-),score=454.76 TRINITY_DN437_c2_g1_i1:110-3547(-)